MIPAMLPDLWREAKRSREHKEKKRNIKRIEK